VENAVAKQQNWPVEDVLVQLQAAFQKENFASWSNEKAAIRTAVESIATELGSRYSFKSALGVGGSGIVLRIRDTLFPAVDNALKFPRPVDGKVEFIAEMVGKEMAFLAGLRHPGIVRVVFYTTLQGVSGYGALPFYLMEAVDGLPSKAFVLDPNTTEAQFLYLIRNTAVAIRYLHYHSGVSFAHLDIKPENILADIDGRPIMIDLGTCKRLDSSDQGTIVACTKSYAHPELASQLARDPSDDKRARGQIKRSDIDPRWDLWSFAVTILSWMGIDFSDGSTVRGALLDRLSPYTRKYLFLLTARLLTHALPSWLPLRLGLSSAFLASFAINSADEMCDLLSRIDGAHGPLDAIPELDLTSTGTIQAGPGTHIPNTDRLSRTLDHRLVRRLNAITQLGVVSQIYPSAKHTRREHSLGTYANCGRVIKALYDDSLSPLFRQIITETNIREILVTALLHDIGQFPLAHDLEEIDKRLFDHDELTAAMLKGTLAKKKKGSKRIHFTSLQDVFSDWGTSADRILAILAARPTNTTASPKDKLLRSIISGPIDADKLDYLFRDARHTDVPYPDGVDVDRLFRCLTTIVIDRVEGGARDVPAIGVHAKGKVSAEFLTLARYAMFSQVYWHHGVRAQKAMLFRAVSALLAQQTTEPKLREFSTRFVDMVAMLPESLYHVDEGSEVLFPGTKHSEGQSLRDLGRGTDLSATDAAVLSWLYDRLVQAKRPEAVLIDGILTRKWFKRLWVVSRDMEEKRWDKIAKAWDQLDRAKRHVVSYDFEKAIGRRVADKAVSITSMSAETTNSLIEQMTAAHAPWLLIDIPGGRPGSETGLHYVLESQGRRLRKDDKAVGVLQPSTIWEEYARDLRQAAGKVRIFCEPRLVDAVDASIGWEVGIDHLVSVFEQLAT
jgi:HD superfamily phosphohydrolase